jgi:hypothetical protein
MRMNAPFRIQFSSMSMFIKSPRPSSMAALKGYADDSQRTGRIWTIAGYIGDDRKWDEFENQWMIVLAKHDVPYFHKKEFGQPNGVYAKWYPMEDHYEEIAAFYRDLTQIIIDCWLSPFFSTVRIDDLERFNAETGQKLEPYPLAAYGCMLGIAKEYDHISEVFFDRVEKVISKLGKAEAYAESDRLYWKSLERVGLIGLQKAVTFRELLPLQAADLLAWEIQRNHLNADEWHARRDRQRNDDERWLSFQLWSMEKYGVPQPPSRKSLEVLAMNGAQPISPIIWDYDQLKTAHRLRRGVWSRS